MTANDTTKTVNAHNVQGLPDAWCRPPACLVKSSIREEAKERRHGSYAHSTGYEYSIRHSKLAVTRQVYT